jgi:hypothetical protein
MPRLTDADLDDILTLQLAVAYAGERAAERGQPAARLGWWNTDLVDEHGGHDLLQRLFPQTFRWAALEAAREAARRRDHALRKGALGSADDAITLFRLGFEVDEQLGERLLEHKRSGRPPAQALPGLAEILDDDPAAWDVDAFVAWLDGSGTRARYEEAPAGRELADRPPSGAAERARRLASALLPLPADRYPLPHWRLDR